MWQGIISVYSTPKSTYQVGNKESDSEANQREKAKASDRSASLIQRSVRCALKNSQSDSSVRRDIIHIIHSAAVAGMCWSSPDIRGKPL